ncbi:unnamed protein product [Ixodes persulcatus]
MGTQYCSNIAPRCTFPYWSTVGVLDLPAPAALVQKSVRQCTSGMCIEIRLEVGTSPYTCAPVQVNKTSLLFTLFTDMGPILACFLG